MTAPHGYTIFKVELLLSKANDNDAEGYFRDLHGAELYRAQERLLSALLRWPSLFVGPMTLGPNTGATIKLSADEHVTMGIAVGEGIETMRLGFSPGWALGDARSCQESIAIPSSSTTMRTAPRESCARAAGPKRAARSFALFQISAVTTSTRSFKGLSYEHRWSA
jgi:hypothetical protein